MPPCARTAFAISLVLWMISLLLPAHWDVHEYFSDMPLEEQSVSFSPGWMLLLLGWAGPFLLFLNGPPVPTIGMIPPNSGLVFPVTVVGGSLASLSWYANVLWMWAIRRLVVGAHLHRVVLLATMILALAALQPIYFGLFDAHGVDSAAMPGLGAYVWALAVCLPSIVAVFPPDHIEIRQGASP
jgi:hypothetical protein